MSIMAKKAKTEKVRILKPVWGKFNLPYTVGKDFDLESKLAGELIKEGFAMATAEAKKLEAQDDSQEGSETDQE